MPSTLNPHKFPPADRMFLERAMQFHRSRVGIDFNGNQIPRDRDDRLPVGPMLLAGILPAALLLLGVIVPSNMTAARGNSLTGGR